MSFYDIAPVARAELDAIWTYFAVDLDNPALADVIRDELFSAFDRLALNPGIGHFRTDLANESLRFWRVRNYLIIYRGEKQPIEIVRVIHGSRDVAEFLK